MYLIGKKLPLLFLPGLYLVLAFNTATEKLGWRDTANYRQQTFQEGDTTKINELIVRAESALLDEPPNPEQAGFLAQEALELSEEAKYNKGIVNSSLFLGRLYKSETKYAQALDYYLKANKAVEAQEDPRLKYEVFTGTSLLYQDWNVYEKAIEYLEKSIDISDEIDDKTFKFKALQSVAIVCRNDSRYDQAIEYYRQLKEVAAQHGNDDVQDIAFEGMLSLYMGSSQLNEALAICAQLLEDAKTDLDTASQIYYYNKIGIIHKYQKNYGPSKANFLEALKLMEASNTPEREQIPIMLSVGVIDQIQGSYEQAIAYFQRAYTIAKGQDAGQEVKALNYLAAMAIGMGNNEDARDYIEEIIEIAEEDKDYVNLEKNYLRLAELYEGMGKSRKALEAYKKYLEVRDIFYEQQKKAQEEILANQLEAEKKEKELKLLVVDQELQKMTFEKLKVDAEKKEQELALLKQQQELQESNLKAEQLERERAQQALVMAEQRLAAEQQKQEMAALQKERELQELALKQKELEEQEKARAIELLEKNNALLEADKQLKDQKLAEEATIRKYGIGILGLVLLVLGVVAFSFIQKQKANKTLRKQQAEIEEQNKILASQKEELRSSMNKLSEANQLVEEQKMDLENKNLRLTDSIKYAERIQTAILPTEVKLASVFDEHFFIFHPKDMVSGDFYWYSQRDSVNYIAAVDCTGHGVPGAFMSMIGNTLLNQIVNERKTERPSRILSELHESVRESLNQKNSNNVDGMDMGFCRIADLGEGKFHVQYSGAKCPIFYYSKGKLNLIKPDRISIGGWHKEDSLVFQNHEFELEKGDIIYMPTDGIIDMANAERRRLGTKNLGKFIEKHVQRPLYEQKLQIENYIGQYQQGTDQRDDITLVAVQL